MGFMNMFRTVRFSISLVRSGGNKQLYLNVSQQLSQCRMLTLTRCWKNQEKPDTLNLDAWKTILRSGTQSPTDQNGSEPQQEEESSIESMQNRVNMWRLAGRPVPDSITTEQLQVLETLTTKSSRKRYLKGLLFKELRKKNAIKKKLERQILRSEMEIHTEKVDTYLSKSLGRREDCLHGWRTVQAMIHGQPLVFDMLYAQYMSPKEIENTVKQLILGESFSRRSLDPFHIHFCNLQPNGPYHEELVSCYGQAWDNLLITTTEKSPVDIFPKDRLVYLTADSPNVLKGFDHNKIYIVGAFVDKSQKTGVSLGVAKRLNLATARLPLDNYLKWDAGAKNLTINQMIEILMTLKETGDWNSALSFVPTRKHLGFVRNASSQSDTSIGRKESKDHAKKTQHPFSQLKQARWCEEKGKQAH